MSEPQTLAAAAPDHRALAWPGRGSAVHAAGPGSQLRFDAAVALLGLLAVLAWEFTTLDLAVSRQFGTHRGFAWRDAWLTRALLHDGGRALGWCVIAFMVGRALWPADGKPTRKHRWYWIGATVLCLLLVPTIKRITASSCPWDLLEFGGAAAYVPHWQLGLHDGGPGHCFPSGHAVAAFAFLTLYFDWRHLRPQAARLSLTLVCSIGALYGWAQLARGAHFVSHTLWSAWLCWATCTLAAWWQLRRAAARQPLSD